MTAGDTAPRIIWHAGFIVDDLGAAMDELTAGLGVGWANPHSIAGQKLQGPKDQSWTLGGRVVFSTDLPLALELIEPTPGTPNTRIGESAFHHLGYWDTDLIAEEERLADLGYGCVMVREDPETALRRVMVNEGPFGILLEATNALTSRPGLEGFYPEGLR
ncbi:VOC family protein [Pseudonocardia kujensis]|uniref:VOC family protein n=1 Tax=Pseudonocardia kujensis TaxID=1128675 RepID=UPI001E4CAED5|nr:VOC family protein [Pseudonocardia kujensis]MCE0763515.1 VOC family protein [Pseudonocardia kujensis]